jgi:hypothetical protein
MLGTEEARVLPLVDPAIGVPKERRKVHREAVNNPGGEGEAGKRLVMISKKGGRQLTIPVQPIRLYFRPV